MYTELILGCGLHESTPKEIINIIEWLFDGNNTNLPVPKLCPPEFVSTRIRWMFSSKGSYYFGASSGHRKLDFDAIRESYSINARCNIKNYEQEFETFLEWLKPFIDQGSGSRELYAITIYEESLPKLWFLKEEDE